MVRDRVRTQVLLLHSEQSTLDNLSSGFDDRYTVHCATSGAEALNTLGDTPIHVIVTARDLPGMSGVEALREARKRSPETIGILLTGDNDNDLEAIVSDKEVFQIVRGGVKPEELTRLVDNATRQIRLLALAESANDVAANPDEPSGEHIVMETSANGSTIITDGAGPLPALDPKKVASAVAAGSSKVDVLVLTKDEDFLTTVRESTRGMHKVHYANTLAQAEQAIVGGKVGVAVVDAAMVGENVEKLTQHLRRKTNRLVSIVAGRRDDGEMLMDLINRGKVYRFLLKPVSPGRARLAIEASVKHHLEAPESAFKIDGATAAPAAKPATKAAAKAAVKPVAKPAVKPAPRPVVDKSASPAAAHDKPAPAGKAASEQPEGPRLDNAFSGGDSGFTETVTGIVTNFGKALTKRKEKPPEKPAEAPRIEPVIGTPRREPAPAVAKQVESAAVRASTRATRFPGPKVLGGAAAALVAVAVLGYFLFGGTDETSRRATASDKANAARDAGKDGASNAAADTGALLDEARLARQAGQIFNPPGNNAIELYVKALGLAPDDPVVAAELAAVVDEALRMAEAALLERRTADAVAALDRVAIADPGNGRLPFLFAQAEQMQLREYLDTALTAIRESRFEDAANALRSARQLEVADPAEIDAVAKDLAAARSQQRTEEVLARAAERLEQGSLVEPANDNARYYYDLVLSNDPSNLLAQQGLSAIAAKLLVQARTELDAGQFDQAAALLDQAQAIDPDSVEVAEASAALLLAREQVAAEELAREAAARAAEVEAEQQRLANERAEEEMHAAHSAPAVEDDPDAEGTATSDREEAAADGKGELLAISELTRVKYVAPKYPSAAERKNLSGWVEVVFTVRADGTTGDIEVRGSDPGDTFVGAAIRAVEKWEFEPIVENGEAVERQTGVRLMFALQ